MNLLFSAFHFAILSDAHESLLARYWLHLHIIIVDISLQPLCIVLYLLYVVSHWIRSWVFPETSGLSLVLPRSQYPGITCDRQSLDYCQWSIHSFTYVFFGSFIYPSDWEFLIFQAYHVVTSRSVFFSFDAKHNYKPLMRLGAYEKHSPK